MARPQGTRTSGWRTSGPPQHAPSRSHQLEGRTGAHLFDPSRILEPSSSKGPRRTVAQTRARCFEMQRGTRIAQCLCSLLRSLYPLSPVPLLRVPGQEGLVPRVRPPGRPGEQRDDEVARPTLAMPATGRPTTMARTHGPSPHWNTTITARTRRAGGGAAAATPSAPSLSRSASAHHHPCARARARRRRRRRAHHHQAHHRSAPRRRRGAGAEFGIMVGDRNN